MNRRIPRELKHDIGKYVALFLFLMLTVGFVSGFLVADNSMFSAYHESFNKYIIEDGHFTVARKADSKLIDELEDKDIKVYEQFYKDLSYKSDKTIRVYKNRTDVNKICLMKGSMPDNDSQIVIDRLFAENNKISLGNKVHIDGRDFTVCGFVALSDYSALFKENSDMMLDANRFCVSVVTDNAYNTLNDIDEKFTYAWKDNDKKLTEKQQSDKADDIMDLLKNQSFLTDFVKRTDNQAIKFTGEDMGSDKSMMTMLLYVVVVVLAFVFAITTKSTIEQESSVIGTLRASGYRRGELMRHYLALPMLVTLVAAALGNVLGYTFIKDLCVGMYYHSYSLPTYVTLWNADAFIKTTVIPCILILIINLAILWRSLSLSPLQFLRHEFTHRQTKKVHRLPQWKFITRFRMRIILQNLPAYLTLFVGILFASILLIFGMVMSPLLANYKNEVQHSQIADYQYILKAPVKTGNKDAEKYSVTSLNIPKGEEITVYGVTDNSSYMRKLKLSPNKNSVIVSNGYLEKYGLKVGDKITLEKKYDGKSYTFTIAGNYNYSASLAVFMPQGDFNETFDYDDDYFSGYFSNEKLTDIKDEYIASLITTDDLTVIANQLDDSMGFMFPLISGFSSILYILLMYLLAKLIVEKNAQAISMVKILGYNDREAGKLYNSSTALVVGISICVSLPIACLVMKWIFQIFMQEINGWMTFYIAPWICPSMLGIGVVCYLIVHLLQMKKIRRIPMSQALKNME